MVERPVYEQSLPQSPQSGTSGVDELQSLIHDGKTIRDVTMSDSVRELEPARRMRKAGFVAAGSTLALGLLTACWAAHSTTQATSIGQHSRQDTVLLAAAEAAAANKTAPPAPCAELGEDCRTAPNKCCATPGYQCFEKSKGWASCRPWCAVGPDPSDKVDASEWSCKVLGAKSAGVAPPPDYSLKAALWVKDKCSAVGEDCSDTKCCKDAGMQCFKKAKGWSACKVDCVPGPDPTDADNHKWDCSPMGMRTPGPPKFYGAAANWVKTTCSKTGENCTKTGCCQVPGMQCFEKHETWAMCKDKCTKGPLLTDEDPGIWSCKPLGGRTPGMAQATANSQIATWVKTKCAKAGDDCTKSMCCADETMQCWTKTKGWSACRKGCNPGNPQLGDEGSGGKWDCVPLGVRTPRKWKTPSLYCFSVIMISTYEAEIMRNAITTDGGVGIFGCEEYDVFSSEGNVFLGDGPSGAVRTRHFDPAPVSRSVDGTAGNTALFMNVWEAVKWVKRYQLTDWTIKADPDAVIFADRLRTHLGPIKGSAYIVNCNKPDIMSSIGPMMFGSLEAISKAGLQDYFNNEAPCKTGYQYGEDRWLGNCLKSVGATPVQDFGIVGDQVCTKIPGSPCIDGMPAYHPYKSWGAWVNCYNQAIQGHV